MEEFLYGTFFGALCITLTLFIMPTEKERFIQSYNYIVPKKIGSPEDAYKCFKAKGKYQFNIDGSGICYFQGN